MGDMSRRLNQNTMKKYIYLFVIFIISSCETEKPRQTYTLSVIVSPPEGGEISISPQFTKYNEGDLVTLTPIPIEGWVFESWGGDLSGTETPQTITIDKNKNVVAKFMEIPKFYLHENGVTCMCPGTKPGEKGFINEVEYVSVDNTLLRQEVGFEYDQICTSLVTDMSRLFYNTDIFMCIENWDVSNVVNMNEMFYRSYFDESYIEIGLCYSDIGKYWNPKSVKNMTRMFSESNFNQAIGGWDVSNAENMDEMFKNALKFNQDLSKWCVQNIVSEPQSFSTNSPLIFENKPKWGTCPD